MRSRLLWSALALASGLLASPAGADPVLDAAAIASQNRQLVRADSLFQRGDARAALAILDSLLAVGRAGRDSGLVIPAQIMKAAIFARTSLPIPAEALARQALAMARVRADSARMMPALRWLAVALEALGRQPEAPPLWGELLAIANARGERDFAGYAELGLAYGDRTGRRAASARTRYRHAADYFRQSHNTYWEVWSLTGLASAMGSSGDLDAERALHLEVLEKSRGANITEFVGYALSNLATLEYSSGDPGRAADYFHQATTLQHSIGNTRGELLAAHNEAYALMDFGRLDDAAAALDSALAIAELRGLRADEQNLLIALGECRRNQGRFGASAALLRRAVALGDAGGPAKGALAVLALAATLGQRDSIPAALAMMQDLVDRRAAQMDLSTRVHAENFLGMSLRRVGRPAAALAVLRACDRRAAAMGAPRLRIDPLVEAALCERDLGRADSALALLERAASLWEIRRAMPASPEWREQVGARSRTLFGALAELRLSLPAAAPARLRVEAAFDELQHFKARTLQERMQGPGRGSDAPPPPSVTLRHFQERVLHDGELFLDCFVVEPQTLLFAVTRDSVRVVRLDDASAPLESRIELLYRLVSAPATIASPGDPQHALALSLRAVGSASLDSLPDLLRASRRVLISPDGPINLLPIAALEVAGGGAAPQALIETHEIVWVPSAGVLAQLRARAVEPRAVPGDHALFAAAGGGAGDPLPGAEREVRELGARYAGVDVFHGSAAGTLPALESLQRYSMLHFASHVQLDHQRPWRSAIQLTAAGGAGDGALRASQVAGANLSARLAVLSGCESAGGRILSGEGVLGLTGAFLSAGVPAVVASLWRVDDRTTADLMRHFYDALARGESAAAALRTAQLEMRRRPATAAPFHWAGFVLVGDPEVTVALQRRRSWPAWSVAALLALALGVVLLQSRSRRGRAPAPPAADRL